MAEFDVEDASKIRTGKAAPSQHWLQVRLNMNTSKRFNALSGCVLLEELET